MSGRLRHRRLRRQSRTASWLAGLSLGSSDAAGPGNPAANSPSIRSDGPHQCAASVATPSNSPTSPPGPKPATRRSLLVTETGHRREARQKLVLAGWRDAILADRYSAVRYDCTNDGVARVINRLTKKVGLAGPKFAASVQPNAAGIAKLVAADSEGRAPEDRAPATVQISPQPEPAAAPVRSHPLRPAEIPRRAQPETAERMEQYRNVFGMGDASAG